MRILTISKKMPRKRSATGQNQFVEVSDEQVKKIRKDQENKNTEKSDKKTEKTFTSYVLSKDHLKDDLEYWKWDEAKINAVLSKFWFEVRAQDGEPYRVSTMKHLFYGINRCFKNHGYKKHLVKDPAFNEAQSAFHDACSALKKIGLGYVESYKEISPQGRNKSEVFHINNNQKIKRKTKAHVKQNNEHVNHNVTSLHLTFLHQSERSQH